MKNLINQLDKTVLPKHIAIIMDGNGRWAKNLGLPRIAGHQKGAEIVEQITELAREVGIKYLTLYAFSKENWNRPTDETKALMMLLFDFLIKKKSKMLQNGIRLNAIGDLKQLPEEVLSCLQATIHETSVGKEMVLTLALSYGARDEMIRAIKAIVADVSEQNISSDHFDENFISSYLDTREMPDPDLIIRTSGETRISNFLLWQGAYSELTFVDPCWPDFTSELFIKCLIDFQKRERRFGRTSEQLD